MGKFKVGDVVKLTEEAAPGFIEDKPVNLVVVEVDPFLKVVSSSGMMFFPYNFEIEKKEEDGTQIDTSG